MRLFFKTLLFLFPLASSAQINCLWKKFHTADTNSIINAISVNAVGVIYCAGWVTDSRNINEGKPNRMLTSSYTSSGYLIWNRYIDTANGTDVIADNSGNCYSLGSTNRALVITKYSAVGNILWRDTINTTISQKVRLDHYGNVIVSGTRYFFTNQASDSKFLIAKYNPYGTRLWIAENDFTPGDESLEDIQIDNQNNIVAVGLSNGPWPRPVEMMKVDPVGNILWTRSYNRTGSTEDYARQLRILPNGNFAIMGTTFIGNNQAGMVYLFDNTGIIQWNVTLTPNDWPVDLDYDAASNIYALETSGSFHKLSTSGTIVWSASTPYSIQDWASKLVLSPNGERIIIAGTAYPPNQVYVAQFDSSGLFFDSISIKLKQGSTVTDLKLRSNGDIYVTGYNDTTIITSPSWNSYEVDTAFLIKFNSVLAVKEQTTISKLSIYPNPSYGIFHIQSTESILSVIVNDLLGREVYASYHPQDEIDLSNFEPGIYILTVKTSKGIGVRNIVLEK